MHCVEELISVFLYLHLRFDMEINKHRFNEGVLMKFTVILGDTFLKQIRFRIKKDLFEDLFRKILELTWFTINVELHRLCIGPSSKCLNRFI